VGKSIEQITIFSSSASSTRFTTKRPEFLMLEVVWRGRVSGGATTRERETLDDMVETLTTHVLQAKNSNLGPYLIGQACFSRRLIGCAGGVAIAGPGSDALVRRTHSLSLTLVEDPEARSCSETRGLLEPDRTRVQDFVDRVGGAQMPAEALRARSAVASGLVVDAIVFPAAEPSAVGRDLASVD
jgi:hypothetical protein